MQRAAAGELPLVAHAVPDARVRRRGGHVAAPRTRTSTTTPAWRPTPTRSPPGSASPTRSSALAEWIEGKEEVHITAPGTDIKLGVAGPHLDARAPASTTCPTASSSPARSRTRSTARSRSRFPAIYGGREVSGVQLRFEDGKVVDASAERGEDFLLEMLDTDEGARRLGELGHRHQLRHRHRHQGDPARREDRRHASTWRSACRYPETGGSQQLRRPLGHGLRPAPGRRDHGGWRVAAGERAVRSRLTGYACATYVHNFPRRTEVSNSSADNGPRPSMSKMRNPSDSRVL